MILCFILLYLRSMYILKYVLTSKMIHRLAKYFLTSKIICTLGSYSILDIKVCARQVGQHHHVVVSHPWPAGGHFGLLSWLLYCPLSSPAQQQHSNSGSVTGLPVTVQQYNLWLCGYVKDCLNKSFCDECLET